MRNENQLTDKTTMNKLKTTLFVIGMLIISIQTIRHIYVRCNYDRPSVLDKYHEDEIDKDIKNSISLDSLIIKFDKAHNIVEDLERGRTSEEIDSLERAEKKSYKTKESYKDAIRDWEEKEEKIYEAIVFWIIGLLLIVAGAFLYYRKLRWIGLSLIITGFIEMIWWSSPDLTLDGATLEFIRFLNIRLALSCITFIIMVAIWLLNKNEKRNLSE